MNISNSSFIAQSTLNINSSPKNHTTVTSEPTTPEAIHDITATHNITTTPNITATSNVTASSTSMKRAYVEDNGSDLSHLFQHAYLLYQKKPAPLLRLNNGHNLLSLLENACVTTMQKFDSLDAQGRSHLHVLLSSCVNTILTNYRP